jgi:hypothetical protein
MHAEVETALLNTAGATVNFSHLLPVASDMLVGAQCMRIECPCVHHGSEK